MCGHRRAALRGGSPSRVGAAEEESGTAASVRLEVGLEVAVATAKPISQPEKLPFSRAIQNSLRRGYFSAGLIQRNYGNLQTVRGFEHFLKVVQLLIS